MAAAPIDEQCCSGVPRSMRFGRVTGMRPLIVILALAVGGCTATTDPIAAPNPSTPPTTAAPATTPATAAPPATTDRTGTAPEPLTPLVEGFDATPPSADWTKPALYDATIDPAYRTTVRRMTSADGTRFDRNTYSRRQAENADGTAFMTYHGDAEYRVYDRADGALLAALPIHPDAEPQWHPTEPDLVRHMLGPNSYVGDLRYYETRVSTGESNVIADLTDRIQAQIPTARYMIDRAEGSPSADGSVLAWIVHDDAEVPVAIVSYDLSTDTVLGTAPLDPANGRLDWVSASPTGTYVVAGYVDATTVFDADLTNERRINNKADHSDIALSADGRDTYVYIDFSADVDGGWLVAVDLGTLERTRLFDLYDDANTSIHISGKAYDMPGWVVASTYNCKVPGAWSCDKVMAVELGGTNRVMNLAHTYNCGDNYWTETHAVANRDLSRVYFNSDGGSCGIDAEVYEIVTGFNPSLAGERAANG